MQNLVNGAGGFDKAIGRGVRDELDDAAVDEDSQVMVNATNADAHLGFEFFDSRRGDVGKEADRAEPVEMGVALQQPDDSLLPLPFRIGLEEVDESRLKADRLGQRTIPLRIVIDELALASHTDQTPCVHLPEIGAGRRLGNASPLSEGRDSELALEREDVLQEIQPVRILECAACPPERRLQHRLPRQFDFHVCNDTKLLKRIAICFNDRRDLSAVKTPVGNNAALHVQRSAPDRQEEREEPQKSFHPPTGITTTYNQTQTRNRRTDGSAARAANRRTGNTRTSTLNTCCPPSA